MPSRATSGRRANQTDCCIKHAESHQYGQYLSSAQAGTHQHVMEMLPTRLQRQLAFGDATSNATEEIRKRHQRKPKCRNRGQRSSSPCEIEIVNQTTMNPSSVLPASPMNVRIRLLGYRGS